MRWGKEFKSLAVNIEVELSPAFKSRVGIDHLVLSFDGGATVKGLLTRLSDEYSDKMRPLLFEKEEILPGLMVMVNQKIFTGTALQVQDIPLNEGDKVSLLYFLSGG